MISEQVQVALAYSMGPVILGVLNLAHQIWASRKIHEVVTAQTGDIKAIEKATNSMKDDLVAATAKAMRAEGVTAGLEQAKNEAIAKSSEP